MKKPKPDDWARLMHIRDALTKLTEFVKGLNEQSFIKDEKTLLASLKLIEITGEAVYHISDDLKKKYPGVPWQQIEGMRHKLVHDYYDVDSAIVWRVASVFAPQLESQIEKIINDLQNPPE